MGEGEVAYVDCFFDNYHQSMENADDYAASVFDAEFSCTPARERTFETYAGFQECSSEGATLYRSKYEGLNANAIAAIEQEMKALTDAVCWPANDLRALPDAPSP